MAWGVVGGVVTGVLGGLLEPKDSGVKPTGRGGGGASVAYINLLPKPGTPEFEQVRRTMSEKQFMRAYGTTRLMPRPPDTEGVDYAIAKGSRLIREGKIQPPPPSDWGALDVEILHFAQTGEVLHAADIYNKMMGMSEKEFSTTYYYPKPPPVTPDLVEAWAAQEGTDRAALSEPEFVEKYGFSKYLPPPPRSEANVAAAAKAAQMLAQRNLPDQMFIQMFGHPKPPEGWGRTTLETVHYGKTREVLTTVEIFSHAAKLSGDAFAALYGYPKPPPVQGPSPGVDVSAIPPLTPAQQEARDVFWHNAGLTVRQIRNGESRRVTPQPEARLDAAAAQAAVRGVFRAPVVPDVSAEAPLGKPGAKDVRSSGTDDSNVLAPMAALAAVDSQRIAQGIQVMKMTDGSMAFEVPLYRSPRPGEGDKPVKERVLVPFSVIQERLDRLGAAGAQATALWPTVIETAYAKQQTEPGKTLADGFQKISAGTAEDAIKAFTGLGSTTLTREAVAQQSAGAFHADLAKKLSEKRPMTVHTAGPEAAAAGLKPNHDYAITKVETDPLSGRWTVTLRDPLVPDAEVRVPVKDLMGPAVERTLVGPSQDEYLALRKAEIKIARRAM